MPRRLNPIKVSSCIPTTLLGKFGCPVQTSFGSRHLSTEGPPRVSSTCSLGFGSRYRVTNSSLRCTSTSITTATNPNTTRTRTRTRTRTGPAPTTSTPITGVQRRTVRLYSPSAAHLFEPRLSSFQASATATATSMARDIVDLTSSPPEWPRGPDVQDHEHGHENETGQEDEDEDDDLKLAIALSLQQHEAEHNKGQKNSALSTFDVPDVAFTTPTPTSDAFSTNGIRGLDRRAMEAERLARLKRKRDAADEGGQADSARISPPPLRRAVASRSQDKQDSTSKVNGTSSHSKSNTTASNTYPQGKVFKTHAPGYPTDDTISFPNLISPLTNLKSALLSSFIWDFDWLLPNFSTYLNRINLLLVMHAKQPFHKQQLEADFERIKTVKLCFPPMDGSVHCMHSKLMLLFYEDTNDKKWRERCRIVVPTGNLVPFDWGVGSVMENMLWVLDLPLLTLTEGAQRQQSTEFKQSLVGFLKAQNVPDAVLTRLNRFDFVETQDMRFVHTIGGAHSGETWRDTGLCGLGKAVSSLELATGDAIDVDFVTSSVGSLNDEFMRSIYLACQGDDGLADYTLRNAKTLPAKRIGASTDKQLVHKNSGSGWKDHFRLYFPSQNTVASSNGGPQSAGTICFSEKWWEGAKFPRGNMRDCLSVRDGMLMHNKVIFVRLPQTIPDGPAEARVESNKEKGYVGWVYLGSANLSESAWGRLVQDKTSKRPKLSCRNWECGVVLPAKEDGAHAGFDVFASVLPMPLKLPAVSLETSKQTPWFFGGE